MVYVVHVRTPKISGLDESGGYTLDLSIVGRKNLCFLSNLPIKYVSIYSDHQGRKYTFIRLEKKSPCTGPTR